jgi:16S rRNA (cytidine1402-2'-O)-methyltransferase
MNKPAIKLFMIPTVLADGTEGEVLSPRIIEVIRELDIFFVENVRTARRFISSLKLGKVIDELTFIELHKDTPEAMTFEALKGLDKNAGVISEAGCPGIADPGAVAVNIAHQLGIQVVPLVGPSSILLAIMGSGLSGQSFAFHGYLPIDKAMRKKAIQALERESRQRQQTQIFMETPFRNNQLLETLLETCLADTMLSIAADITGPEEFMKTKTIRNWKVNKPDLHKRPTIFLIG